MFVVKGERVVCNPKCAVQTVFIVSGFALSGSRIPSDNNGALITGGRPRAP